MKLLFVQGEVNIKVFLTYLSLFWHGLKALSAPCHCHPDRLHTDRFNLLCILTEQEQETYWEKNKEALQKSGQPDTGVIERY